STAELSLDAARRRAGDILAARRMGHDPAADIAARRTDASDVCGKAFDRYLRHQRAELRPVTYKQTQPILLDPCNSFPDPGLTNVRQRAIAEQLSEIADERGPTAADHARSVLTAFYSWAMKEGLADANPAINTIRRGSKARERVLSEAELIEVWRALPDTGF